MKELAKKYLNGEITSKEQLDDLHNNPKFMLEVFRIKKDASEFDKCSDNLKNNLEFINKTKNIFRRNQEEFYRLVTSLRRIRIAKYLGNKDEQMRNVTPEEENNYIKLFSSLLDKIPINQKDKDYLIKKYREASIEIKTNSLIMLYNFTKQQEKEDETKCLRK